MDTAARPTVVALHDARATEVGLVGAKAANLATARAAGLPTLPGVVLTTAWHDDRRADAVRAWRAVSDDGARAVVVRSSSTGEDGDASSMAGVFESILGVAGEDELIEAVDAVLASAERARRAGLVDASMAVLVQPMLDAVWGGVLFGADPLTGRRDRIVVAAVPGGPDRLVSGEADGWTGVLGRRGRVLEVRSTGDAPRPPDVVLRQLAALAAEAARAFGGPQDVEWAVDAAGAVHLLQARPITTLPPTSGPVYGPGPVAESFPEPLAPLEQDLWLAPLRDGLREALLLTGTSPAGALRASPLVIAVDGLAAVDLGALGADEPQRGLLRRLDPRPPARRLRAAWRVGRLRTALPELALDLVEQVDADLLEVPALDTLGDEQLLAVLRNGRRSLVSLHGHEALVGLLIPSASAGSVTGASMALAALARAQDLGTAVDDLVAEEPVVLALVPPRIGATGDVLAEVVAAGRPAAAEPEQAPHPAAIAREALRVRIRWVQELMARSAWELGRRLAAAGALRTAEDVRDLCVAELEAVVHGRIAFVSSGCQQLRSAPAATRALPARFRLDAHGRPWAVPRSGRRRRLGSTGAGAAGAVAASGGTATGPVHHHDGSPVPDGSVLVVAHLDPRLAAVIPRLAGLVAETGSPLSHLAILAREHGVPAVVGLSAATTRFRPGEVVTVDGDRATVTVVEPAAGLATAEVAA